MKQQVKRRKMNRIEKNLQQENEKMKFLIISSNAVIAFDLSVWFHLIAKPQENADTVCTKSEN